MFVVDKEGARVRQRETQAGGLCGYPGGMLYDNANRMGNIRWTIK